MLIRSVWTRLKRALDQARVYLNRQNITTFVAAKHSDNASALALICQAFIIALGRPAGAQFPQRHAASLLTGKRQSSDCSQCLFQAPFLGWGNFPTQKNLQFPPQTAAKFCALSLFFSRDNELQTYHGNFLLMDNKHRKLFVTEQSKGRKFMPKCTEIRLAYALPQTP